MKNKLQKLKQTIIIAADNPDFIHHSWMVKYHLNIVGNISLELCEIYKEADENIVLALVWLHDYGKILAQQPEHFHKGDKLTISEGTKILEKIGFDNKFRDTVINYVDTINKKLEFDLNKAPIEAKIVSSADAASHFIGPFFSLHWYENCDRSIDYLIDSNIRKAKKDWRYKIVLPEIKKRFRERYNYMIDNSGTISKNFL